nr:uncharacterized protein LOC100214625 [Hydra vulgaris]
MAKVEDKEIRKAAIEGCSASVVKMSLLDGGDRRRYNLPSHDEVAGVFVGEYGAPPTSREQYAVDAYVKIEGQRLAFIRNNQNKLRSEQYDALHEHIKNNANDRNIRPGRVVVLPSSYREITENLYSGQNANDRPDLVTRVFKLKLNNFLNDIFNYGVLGKVVTHVQVIEFQKRGLPHAHILLHLANDDKLETSQDIDNLICAEIPDPIVNCERYGIIKTCMIHGPCGILNLNSPCMKDGVCSKNYPKDFNANTVAVHNGYSRYRRRDNGLVINIKGKNVDNRWGYLLILGYQRNIKPTLMLKLACL